MSSRPYEYRCEDRSILTPRFRKYLVAPLLQWVPYSIPANYLSIIAGAMTFVATGVCYQTTGHAPNSMIASAILLFLYAILDHLDGMQAKRSKTSSALGEFCDHFLDVFSTGLVAICFLRYFQVTDPTIWFSVLASAYLLHASLIYNQFKTGVLKFDPIGSLEGLVLVIALMVLGSMPIFYNFMIEPLVGSISPVVAILYMTVIGNIISASITIKRTGTLTKQFALFTGATVVLWYVCPQLGDPVSTSVVFIAYAAVYIGSIIHGHLIDGKERYPDVVVPIFALSIALGFTQMPIYLPLIWGLSLWLAFRIGGMTTKTFMSLKEFWHWKNPAQ